jgi:NADH-quinone oxidoreductase subunit M
VVPLFPLSALMSFAPVAMTLGVLGILYGAVLAFAQTDLKRLVAYTSISHMGFVLLGIFAWNQLALQGVVLILIAHGVGTGAMFIMAGSIAERLETRDMGKMGGLWSRFPRMGGFTLFLALALLGLPGMSSFVGEFLVLLGAFPGYPVYVILASIGFVLSVIYALWMVQRTFFGPQEQKAPGHDLLPHETAMMLAAAAVIIWLGIYPQPVINTANAALRGLQQITARRIAPAGPMTGMPPGGPASNGGTP